MTPKNILLLEDDPHQSATYQKRLKRQFAGADIMHLETEYQLREYVKKLKSTDLPMPDVVVSDVMMPWTFPAKKMPPVPSDVKVGGFRRAGVRCLKHFRSELGKNTTWYLFTIIDQEVIKNEIEKEKLENATVLNKEEPLEDLFTEIETRLGLWKDNEQQETDYLTALGLLPVIKKGLATKISECFKELER